MDAIKFVLKFLSVETGDEVITGVYDTFSAAESRLHVLLDGEEAHEAWIEVEGIPQLRTDQYALDTDGDFDSEFDDDRDERGVHRSAPNRTQNVMLPLIATGGDHPDNRVLVNTHDVRIMDGNIHEANVSTSGSGLLNQVTPLAASKDKVIPTAVRSDPFSPDSGKTGGPLAAGDKAIPADVRNKAASSAWAAVSGADKAAADKAAANPAGADRADAARAEADRDKAAYDPNLDSKPQTPYDLKNVPPQAPVNPNFPKSHYDPKAAVAPGGTNVRFPPTNPNVSPKQPQPATEHDRLDDDGNKTRPKDK